MAYTGLQTPSNRVVAAGKPAIIEELKVETATNMYPARLVKKGTNDDDVVVNTAKNTPYGWLGFEDTSPEFRPADIDTIYAADAQAAVLSGGGFVIRGRLADGNSVSKGDPLVAAANGEVQPATQVNIESGSTAVESSGADGEIIDGSLGEEGLIVGAAAESADASGGAVDFLIKSYI